MLRVLEKTREGDLAKRRGLLGVGPCTVPIDKKPQVGHLLEADVDFRHLGCGSYLDEAVEHKADISHVILEGAIGCHQEVVQVREGDVGRQALEHGIDHTAKR